MHEVGQGFTNVEIGRHLYLSPMTVKSHLSRITRHLKTRGRVRIALYQVRNEIVQLHHENVGLRTTIDKLRAERPGKDVGRAVDRPTRPR